MRSNLNFAPLRWDEWLDVSRIVAFNEAGRSLQKSLLAIHGTVVEQCEEKGVQSIEEDPADQEMAGRPDIPVIFKLGKNFKHFANFDWMQVAKRSKILSTFPELTVELFLQTYADEQANLATGQFVSKFLELLNVSIGKTLLYRSERYQYMLACKKAKPTSIYGPEILIRFFGKL